jgi:hypothetical protein
VALSLFSLKNGHAMVILSCGLFRIFLDPPRFGSVSPSPLPTGLDLWLSLIEINYAPPQRAKLYGTLRGARP